MATNNINNTVNPIETVDTLNANANPAVANNKPPVISSNNSDGSVMDYNAPDVRFQRGVVGYLTIYDGANTERVATVAVATSTTLNDITSTLNTTGKYTGKFAFNTTVGYPVWASGSTAGAVWVDATGATVNTPV